MGENDLRHILQIEDISIQMSWLNDILVDN